MPDTDRITIPDPDHTPGRSDTPDVGVRTLSDPHREYLTRFAITDDVIDRLGIFTVDGLGIAFPWVDHAGTRVTTMRPDTPPIIDGKAAKYVWPKAVPLILWTVIDAGEDSPIVLVEGHKQSLAVGSWIPDGYSVYGMNGCRGWAKCDLEWTYGRKVFVFLDADAATNFDVYTAGAKLKEELELIGADDVRFPRFPGAETEGADDYLARLATERRTSRIQAMIDRAHTKPAVKAPTQKAKDRGDDGPVMGTLPDGSPDDRPVVVVNDDRRAVIDQILTAIHTKYNGTRLFNYGGGIAAVEGATVTVQNRDQMLNVLAESCATFSRTQNGFTPAWPEAMTMGAVMARADEFSPLRRVVQVPFVRPDGSVVTESGYDAQTATVAVLDDLVTGLVVADAPSDDQIQDAVALIDDWLEGFEWRTPGSRAGAFALVLTPFIRGLVQLVPLAVVNGLQMGSGKNLLLDCLSILVTGHPAAPMPYTDDDDENRKVITSAFRTGQDLFVFDEAHEISSKQLARALTSVTYRDRLLGVSTMLEFPNQVTWVSLGNGVQVNGDMSRRVHFVEIWPSAPNPQDRGADAFAHPDLRKYTTQSRAQLVTAVLTIIRGWFAAGQPSSPRTEAMGSFEAWDRMVSGILHHAGVGGFLDDLKARRSESDYEATGWVHHFQWLLATFGVDQEFTCSDVKHAALRETDDGYPGPPGLWDPLAKGYTRSLGVMYKKISGRWIQKHKMDHAGIGHRSVSKWVLSANDL